MKTLGEYINEERGWGGNAAMMGTRKIDWKSVGNAIADEKTLIKFLKDNGLPTKGAEAWTVARRGEYANNYKPVVIFRIDVDWTEDEFKRWIKDRKIKTEYYNNNVIAAGDYLDDHMNILNLNAFKIKPTSVGDFEFLQDDSFIRIVLGDPPADEVEAVIDQISPKADANLPVFGTPGGENDGVGRKIMVDDIVAVMPRTGSASNRVYRLGRVIGNTAKRWTILTGDSTTVNLEGELMIIVQRNGKGIE